MTKITLTKWNHKLKELDSVTDGLGLGLDKDIKETIAALNLLGVNTSASCEGHPKWGLPYPWVDIQTPKGYDLSAKAFKFKAGSKEFKKIVDKITILNVKESKKMLEILNKYYKNYSTDYNNILVISSQGWGSGRLQPNASILAEMDKTPNRLKLLKIYQKEMQLFTKFLKSELGLATK